MIRLLVALTWALLALLEGGTSTSGTFTAANSTSVSYAYDSPASRTATIYSHVDRRSPSIRARETVSASQLHDVPRWPGGSSSAQSRSRHLRYVYDAFGALASPNVDQLAVGGSASRLLPSPVAIARGLSRGPSTPTAGSGLVRSVYDRGMSGVVTPDSGGLFSVTRTIGGQAVTLDGRVINGIPRIGTAYIKP